MGPVRVLLISTYELGRQPFGVASPAAWLRDAGAEVTCLDVSRQALNEGAVRAADRVGFYLPMHTATRLAMTAVGRVRALNPRARLAAFGIYAPLNEQALRAKGVEAIFGGEFEQDLVAWVQSPALGNQEDRETPGRLGRQGRRGSLPRLSFRVPDRSSLPPLHHYASLRSADGARRTVGYTEASRGCKHWCRHCPIVPVYGGRFRVVPKDIVLADVRAQVAAGAEHITFGDPDFFNGIGHATALVQAFHREFPRVTYDVTIKIEHLLVQAAALPLLAETGCLFVTSAVESVDDRVLTVLEKGHTREDVGRAVARCREAGLALSPTFVPFTPWTTLETYADLLQTIAALDLIDQAAPIQLAIRLLIPDGSRLLDLAEVRGLVGPFDESALAFPWRHPDPRVDALQRDVEQAVGARLNAPRREVFAHVWQVAHAAASIAVPPLDVLPSRAAMPYLTEPWYC
jgi:radical SAM superfamily enzyme YgiQ (UPF0313 family)